MRKYALRDDQWERIKDLLPGREGTVGVTAKDNHPFVVIPPKKNRQVQRSYDKALYKARHLIENFFAKLKQFRAIATRYDKRSVNFLGAIHLAASIILLA
ncbi:MAG: transposase [Cyanobacteriota bacterium]